MLAHVKTLLSRPGMREVRDTHGHDALIIACRAAANDQKDGCGDGKADRDHAGIVRWLVQGPLRMDPHSRGTDGANALHWAVRGWLAAAHVRARVFVCLFVCLLVCQARA